MKRRNFLIQVGLGTVGTAAVCLKPPNVKAAEWQPDGTATVARFGLLTPAFDPVPESEIWTMLPAGFSVHAARIVHRRSDPRSFAEPPNIDDATEQLAGLAPRAIISGFTSSSYMLGTEGENQLRVRLEQRSKGIPVIIPCRAATDALRFIKAKKITVINPPWFPEQADELAAAYFRAQGFDVIKSARVAPARSFTEVKPEEVYEFVSANTPRAAEAVFIGGNGLRAIGAIHALERKLRKPVLSANQVTLWAALSAVGQTKSVTKYGTIFAK